MQVLAQLVVYKLSCSDGVAEGAMETQVILTAAIGKAVLWILYIEKRMIVSQYLWVKDVVVVVVVVFRHVTDLRA